MMKSVPRFRSDSGIGMAVVVILILVTTVLVFTSVLLYARLTDAEAIQKRLADQVVDAGKRKAAIMSDVKVQLAPTGLIASEEEYGSLDAAKVAEVVKTRRNAILVADESEVGKRLRAAQDESGLFSTLQDLIVAQAATLAHLQQLHDHVRLDVDIAKIHSETREGSKPDLLRPKEQYKVRLQAMITDLKAKIDAEDAAYTARKAQLNESLTGATTAIDEERSAFIQYEIKENNKIKDLRRRLNDMKVKEVIKHEAHIAHGRIIKPDAERKNGFINLGSRDRVVPGLRFRVARIGKEGKFEFKADIEVKKVWMDTSEVAILKNYEGTLPVIDGDLIVNPFFNTRRPVVVAFVGHTGERTYKLRYTAREASNRIREIGSEARVKAPGDTKIGIDLDADFVLFTETTGEKITRDLWDDYKRAVQLEIPLAEASEYYHYLGE